jgi:hypothetical protein
MSLLETAQRTDDDGCIYLRLSPRVAPTGKGEQCRAWRNLTWSLGWALGWGWMALATKLFTNTTVWRRPILQPPPPPRRLWHEMVREDGRAA